MKSNSSQPVWTGEAAAATETSVDANLAAKKTQLKSIDHSFNALILSIVVFS